MTPTYPRRWKIRKARSGRWWVMVLTHNSGGRTAYFKVDDQPTWEDARDYLDQFVVRERAALRRSP